MPTLLSVNQLFQLHVKQADDHGGLRGVRHQGLLRQAALEPSLKLEQEEVQPNDLFKLAAIYALEIIKIKPFVSGNVRTASLAAEAFLGMNHVILEVHDDDFVDQIARVSADTITLEELAEFFRNHSSSGTVAA